MKYSHHSLRSRTNIFIFTLIASLLLSCASNQVRSSSDRFKVSVSSNGRTVSNANQVLVHRVKISKSKLDGLYRKGIQDLNAELVKDLRGSTCLLYTSPSPRDRG